jgi:hypothetical protein
MARFTGATLSVLGGLAGALFVAGAVATGCGGDDNGGTTTNSTSTSSKSSSSTGTSSTGTTSATSSTSATTGADAGDAGDAADGSPGDAGDAGDGDATLPPCNTAALLNIDAGNLLFSFNDGSISTTVGTTPTSWSAAVQTNFNVSPTAPYNPLDAAFDVTGQGSATVGNSCPGSFEFTVPFSTTGQVGVGQFNYPGNGAPYNAKAIHLSIKYVLPDNTDASTAYIPDLSNIGTDGGNGFIQPFVQWAVPPSDGGAPAAYSSQNFSVAIGWSTLPADGGWYPLTVPITGSDGGTVYLNQIGVQAYDPQFGIDGAVPLPFPATVQFYVDDVWFE